MNINFKQKKLPTLVGLILLVLGVLAGVILVQRTAIFSLRAEPAEEPQEVRVTNVKENSFTVSWITEKETLGFLAFGDSKSLGSATPAESTPSFTHQVTPDNLKDETVYFFKVGSGKNLFDQGGQPYEAQTAPPAVSIPIPDIIFGTVEDESGGAAPGAIVYVTISGASPLSAQVLESGSWTVNLSMIRTLDLSRFATYTKEAEIQIFVQAGNGRFARALILAGAAHPVPTITLGQTHDFTNIKPLDASGLPSSNINLPEEATESGQEATTSSRFSVPDSGESESATVKLDNPENKEVVGSARPEFNGSGSPGTTFTIAVESPATYSGNVTVDKNGDWSWTPPKSLSAGPHTVTVSWKDEDGVIQKITRSFTVLAAGESDLPSFSATPSATPTASPTASPRVAVPATDSGVPVSGNLTPTISLFIMGLVLLLLGITLPKVIKI